MKNRIAKPFGFGRRTWLLAGMLILLFSVVGSGCLPPPPRQSPKAPTPPGGPNAGAVQGLRPATGDIFLNLQV